MNVMLDNWPHSWYGYFGVSTTETPQLPMLAEVTDPLWQPSDKQKLVKYLRTAPVFVQAVSSSAWKCPLCGVSVGLNDTVHLTDNMWLWPEDLFHIVEKHNVVLPSAFVEHIRSRNYHPPLSVAIKHDHFKWPSQETESLDKYRNLAERNEHNMS